MTPTASLGGVPPERALQQNLPGEEKEDSEDLPAEDDSGSPDIESQALFDRLLPSIEAIEAAANKTDPDFYSVRIDWESKGLTIYRKGGSGPLDDFYQALLPGDVVLAIRDSAISSTEKKEIAGILNENFDLLQSRGTVLLWSGVENPGEGYLVQYKGNDPLTRADIAGLSRFSDEQIRFELGEPVLPLGRLGDTSPFYGGSRLHTPLEFRCSSGFPVRTSDGKTWLTTAWHCNKSYDNRFWTPTLFLGFATLHAETIDHSVIDVTAQGRRTAPYVFTGGYPDQSQTKRVQGVIGARDDMPVCASGSYMYAKCGLYIQESDTWSSQTNYGGPFYNMHGWRVAPLSGFSAVVASGDSGGPVYSYNSTNTAVSAVGIVSGAVSISQVTCPARLNGHVCAYRFFMTSSLEAAIHFGLQYTW